MNEKKYCLQKPTFHFQTKKNTVYYTVIYGNINET